MPRLPDLFSFDGMVVFKDNKYLRRKFYAFTVLSNLELRYVNIFAAGS